MSWPWSHTQEAYDNVYENIQNQSREWLEVVFAEWHVASDCDNWQSQYDKALAKAKTLPEDVLADYIWGRTSDFATCTNGGHYAHCCPHGCDCHMLSFDLDKTKHAATAPFSGNP